MKKQDSQIRDLAARSGAQPIEDDGAFVRELLARMQEEDDAALKTALAVMQEEAASAALILAMLLQEGNEEARILEYLLSNPGRALPNIARRRAAHVAQR